jgi:hypothetical protein
LFYFLFNFPEVSANSIGGNFVDFKIPLLFLIRRKVANNLRKFLTLTLIDLFSRKKSLRWQHLKNIILYNKYIIIWIEADRATLAIPLFYTYSQNSNLRRNFWLLKNPVKTIPHFFWNLKALQTEIPGKKIIKNVKVY